MVPALYLGHSRILRCLGCDLPPEQFHELGGLGARQGVWHVPRVAGVLQQDQRCPFLGGLLGHGPRGSGWGLGRGPQSLE